VLARGIDRGGVIVVTRSAAGKDRGRNSGSEE
jgi:hypothetical protein